jgi:hypothetical protein
VEQRVGRRVLFCVARRWLSGGRPQRQALAVAALLATLLSLAPARADQCNLQGAGSAVTGAWNDITACAGSGEFIPVALALAIAIGEAGSAGTDACNTVQGDLSQLTQWTGPPGTASSVVQKVENQFSGLNLGEDANQFFSQLSSAVSVPNTVGSVIKCACTVASSVGNVFTFLGDCTSDALCSMQAAIGLPSCNCTQSSTTQPALCTGDLAFQCAEGTFVWNGPANQNPCLTQVVLRGAPPYEQPVDVKNAVGETVTIGGPGGPFCGEPLTYCYCPAPMVGQWMNYTPSPYGDQQMFVCECPAGSSPPSNLTGPVTSTCVCDNGPDAGLPTPPSGQCPAACPATQVPVLGGGCCDPSQVAQCGLCCPAGMRPDPQTGNCQSAISTTPVAPRL